MKKLALPLFLAVLTFTIYSCGKDGVGGGWSAKVNGQSRTGNASIIGYTSLGGSHSLSISLVPSLTATDPKIILGGSSSPDDITTGTYNLDGSTMFSGGYDSATTIFASGFGGNGELKLTKFDLSSKTISATFKFTAKTIGGDSVVVTDGSFTDASFTTY